MKSIVFIVLAFILFFPSSIIYAQSGSIEGVVTNEDGEPLPGVSVLIQGSNKGRSTNANGTFLFENMSPGDYVLIARLISFESDTVSVTVRSNQASFARFQLKQTQLVLEDLIVTAQKRTQSLQEVPITISSLSGEFLSNSNIREFDRFSAYVPGLEVQIQSVNNPGFVIRGITSDSGDSRVEPRVSVFQDGVSISKSRGSIVELFDLERVEVLKGPQGTLFGRGAQIGAIHIIQNKPNNQLDGEVTFGGGNEDEILAKGFLNIPIVNEKLFTRIAAVYNERDGFIDNISGGDLNGKETFAIRSSVRYIPSNNTIIDAIFNYQEDTPPGTSFKSGTFAPAGGSTDPNTFADMERGEDLFIDRTVWGITLLADHTIGNGFSLNSITAYREFDSFESFDADGTIAPVLWFAEDAEGEQFSQEIRLNYDAGRKFSGFTGASYFYEDGFQRVPFETDERSYFALLSPLLAGAGLPVPVFPLVNPDGSANLSAAINPLTGEPFKTFHSEVTTNFGTTNAIEIFADGTYQATDKLAFTGGVRFTYEDIEGALNTPIADSPGSLGFVLGVSPNNLFAPTDGKISESETFTSIIGRFVTQYDFNSSTNLFASFSRGRRPNVINVTASNTNILSSEIVWSYELGLKKLFLNNRFSLDMSGFFYDYNNFQTSVTELTADGLVTETRDSGEATAFGFETTIRANLLRGLSVFGNYGLVDATIDDEDSDGNPQELAGNRFRLTPKHSFSVGADLEKQLSGEVGFFVSPSYTWKSRVFFEEDNQEGIEQEGYGLLHLKGGFRLFDNRLELAAYATNLLDKEFIIDAGNTGGAFGIPTFIAGPPRFFGLQLTGRI